MDKNTQAAWKMIDKGLLNLMAKNDELSDRELQAKTRRLKHLAKFVDRLAVRVSERLRENTKPGPIDVLFIQYQAERRAIDAN